MAWEPVDRWPGESGGGGAFRAASEPVVAERGAPTPAERLRLWWHSTPELPMKRVARRALLTSHFVYVERPGGKQERTPREKLRGVRRSGSRLVFGVVEGEDLVLPYRVDCAFSRAVLAQLGGDADAAWTSSRYVVLGGVAGFAAIAVAVGLLGLSPLERILSDLQHGHQTSERVLTFLGGWAVLLVGFGLVALAPRRTRVDRLGVEVRLGLLPWLTSFCPAEAVVGIRTRRVMGTGQQAGHLVGWEVYGVFDPPRRFMTWRARDRVQLAFVAATGRSHREVQEEARTIADRVTSILGARR